MKRIAQYILAGLFLIPTFSANAISVFPSSIDISPSPQTNNDFLFAEISGYFASPGHALNAMSLVNTGSNNFDIDFDIIAPTGIVLAVLDPFSYSVDLGVLDAGNYSITANFYVGNILDSSISDRFSVSSVPLPASIWLLLIGFLPLVFFKKKKQLTITTNLQT